MREVRGGERRGGLGVVVRGGGLGGCVGGRRRERRERGGVRELIAYEVLLGRWENELSTTVGEYFRHAQMNDTGKRKVTSVWLGRFFCSSFE